MYRRIQATYDFSVRRLLWRARRASRTRSSRRGREAPSGAGSATASGRASPRPSPRGSEPIRPPHETAPPSPPFVLESTIARGLWNEQARPLYPISDRQRAVNPRSALSNGRAQRERSEPGYFVIALGCERVGQSVEPH